MASTYGHPDEQEFGLGYDGTKYYYLGAPGWDGLTEQSNATLRNINDWSTATKQGYSGSGAAFTLIFPESRNIAAWDVISSYDNSSPLTSLETSTDATAPNSGTWQLAISGNLPGQNNVTVSAARVPNPVSWPNIKAVRWSAVWGGGTNYIYGFHLWGTYAKTGLEFIDASTAATMNGKNFDFGDVMQGSLTDRTFRIRNNSAQTASNVVIGGNGAGTGGIVGGLTFSDGGAYLSALNIGTLAPGAISSVITARCTVAAAATLRVEATRVTAIAGSWT